MITDDGWYDAAAGPLVRPYAITSGRTPADSSRLDLSTQVSAIRSNQERAGLLPEYRDVLRLCRRPVSIAEIAADMKIPLGVIRVLVGDLIERGLVITRSPAYDPVHSPDLDMMRAILDGLHKL